MASVETAEQGLGGTMHGTGARVTRLLALVVSACALAWLVLPAAVRAADATAIEAFVREGCPHCAEAEAFLAQLQRERPQLQVSIRDVQKEPAALERLEQLARAEGQAARVPAVYVGGQLIVGYSAAAGTDRVIRSVLAGVRAPAGSAASGEETSCEAVDSLSCARPGAEPAGGPQASAAPVPEDAFAVTLLGRTITLADVGLPAFTLAMGLLDGFNPCSMWVLLLMISLLAPLNDRRRMVAVAGTFVLVQGIAYFLFMTAWLNLFLFIGLSRASQLVIASIAVVAGAIHVKDFFAFKQGVSLSIPESAKPGIYQRMRGILRAPSYTAAIAGTLVLAVLVQVVEFMCTSGFPALFTRILTLRQLDSGSYYGYLLLYNAAYMLDDIVVLTVGVVMLSRARLQEEQGRWLKLLAGSVMIGLGIYLAVDG
jgi:glutaredoxin